MRQLLVSKPLVFLAFCALAVFWTWPVAASLSSRIAHDPGDPVLNAWILWWNAETTPFTERWWNAPMMWPMPGAMALSEHLVGVSLVATPLQWSGVNPIGAYNICFVLTYALSGFFAYLLCLRLTGSTLGAICAGLAFGFSPYRAAQLPHIQVLSSQWMPLALLGLHAYVSTGAIRWLAVFGAAWLIQALSNGYYLLFFPVFIACWIVWFVDWRRTPRRGAAIVLAWILSSLPLVPVLLKYREVHDTLGLVRSVPEIRGYMARLDSFFHPAPLMKLWSFRAETRGENELFVGYAVVALAAAGVALLAYTRVRRKESSERWPLLFYVLATVLMWTLALGPGGRGNEPASSWYPYSWLLALPGYDGLRVPARFAMLGTLGIAMAAGIGAARLSMLVGRWTPVLGVMAAAGLVADGLTHDLPVASAPGRIALEKNLRPAVIEIPIDNLHVSVGAMYRSAFHRQPTVNGYSGHIPPHYFALSLSLWHGDSSPLIHLARRRPLVIIVNENVDPGAGFRGMVEALPGIMHLGTGAGGSMFLLPQQPWGRPPPTGGPTHPFVVNDRGRALLEFDLGAARDLMALEFPLRKRWEDLSPRLRVEASDDGQGWREAWMGWTGGLALDAILADPLVAPIQIPLAGVRARYLRVYPAPSWMKSELAVH